MSKANDYVQSQPLVFRTKKGDVIANVASFKPDPKETPRAMLNIRRSMKLFLDSEDAVALGRWILDTFEDRAR